MRQDRLTFPCFFPLNTAKCPKNYPSDNDKMSLKAEKKKKKKKLARNLELENNNV